MLDIFMSAIKKAPIVTSNGGKGGVYKQSLLFRRSHGKYSNQFVMLYLLGKINEALKT